ncbi:HAD family hydrolase [Micromonospora narathiwatensis]|uniref:FMN phosphatase YigB, HAD superfamily n=1 Tax=Micromonospora narathiwatensis TaxID=299146 RepID=A0A1A8ZAL1_9ACTN|nr:HAD family hydrolase [Micromonospora narathiwatensis]SBT40837.1 FMN phosphatase YigB, HAD superfamily [Micromonospora narathiwatensis]
MTTPKPADRSYLDLAVALWEALWLPTTGSGLSAAVADSLHTHEIRVWETIIESLGGHPGQAVAVARTFRACRRRALRLLPGVETGLTLLGRRHVLWVATNGLPAHQRMKIAATGLEPLLDRVLISGEIGVTKADPGFAAAVGRSLRKDGQQVCLVVGDSATQDLQLASNGAWQAAHICLEGACAGDAPRGVVVTHARLLANVSLRCGC